MLTVEKSWAEKIMGITLDTPSLESLNGSTVVSPKHAYVVYYMNEVYGGWHGVSILGMVFYALEKAFLAAVCATTFITPLWGIISAALLLEGRPDEDMAVLMGFMFLLLGIFAGPLFISFFECLCTIRKIVEIPDGKQQTREGCPPPTDYNLPAEISEYVKHEGPENENTRRTNRSRGTLHSPRRLHECVGEGLQCDYQRHLPRRLHGCGGGELPRDYQRHLPRRLHDCAGVELP